ncbi:uncharacterized protein LOC119395047 [Rhipicephalus sanguineus]|uniref:uncharacterized protein LOC119395047 n=1 Tax=Rhipicephalus sanguineus TaxID=34632 RepID=UPI0020C3E93F|nr:uncharacterized protein LOC119395047 [Rhipicephalus sanguineus]
MRTSDQVKSEMRLASQFKDAINGLKGPSALMNLKGLDLVNGYSVEYMHCVLLDVAKQVIETILPTSNSHQRFYSGSPSALSQIDARLLSIKPPHCITRLPRSIQERSYWKASEWRHWDLFYSLHCLSGILIEEYWRHLSKLSEGVYILLKNELTAQEIDKAEFLLTKFVSRCEALYGVSFMTYNVHALLHLASCARSLGPLWAHGAFVFEGGNGTIHRAIIDSSRAEVALFPFYDDALPDLSKSTAQKLTVVSDTDIPPAIPGLSNKFLARYDGPYRIKGHTSPVNYIVEHLTPPHDHRHRGPDMVHVSRLKPYYAP